MAVEGGKAKRVDGGGDARATCGVTFDPGVLHQIELPYAVVMSPSSSPIAVLFGAHTSH